MQSARVNDWFAYQYNDATSGKPKSETAIERFVVKEINGDDVVLARDINNGKPEIVKGKTSNGSFVFDYSSLEKKGSVNMKTPFGSMYVTIYENEDAKNNMRVFVGRDNIAFRIVNTHQTKDGLRTETHELQWSSVKL